MGVEAQFKHPKNTCCMLNAACAIKQMHKRSIGYWGQRKEKKERQGQGRWGDEDKRTRRKRKRRDGCCSWPVENTTRRVNPVRQSSAGQFLGDRPTRAPNSVKIKKQRIGGGSLKLPVFSFNFDTQRGKKSSSLPNGDKNNLEPERLVRSNPPAKQAIGLGYSNPPNSYKKKLGTIGLGRYNPPQFMQLSLEVPTLRTVTKN